MGPNSASPEKFAIVGTGCRMPPNANSLTAFWRFLMRGGNALRPIKSDRWDWRQFWDADPRRPGKTYQAKGAFLDADIRQFDPLAFGMSPREAASLDPQQRLLLEAAWETFEDAGIPLAVASGSATGVFVGGFCPDHMLFQAQPSNRHLINAHAAGGVMMTVLSNRLSHAFNLRGPSITLDTACSSSLVALHYACQSLRLRECDMALAGGVNVMTRPEFPIIMSKGHFLSDHGECHAFDETASGYARGEGAGLLLLKRYADAVAAGDMIHAVVRATGVNQDGHTDGISLPNSAAQEELIGRVYRDAGIPLSEIDYVEAHGTGTQAGDAAELGALHRSFADGRKKKLIVGSVKSNIGHLEAAAGVAGLLKVIGVLKNRQVPKNLHFKNPNPKIPFADYCVEVAAEARTLPAADEKAVLFAGINSFGYGGTNAHALLESAPPPVEREPAAEADLRVIPLSARNEKALRDLAGKAAFQIGQGLPGTLGDLAYSCAFRRNHLEFRAAAVTSGFEALKEQLIALSTGEAHEGVSVAAKAVEPGAGLVFVYTGMGPQWWGMGRELIQSEPVVAEALREIDEVFHPLAGWSLRAAMMADETGSRMAHTDLAQPANFALQVALTRLWESFGIRPAAVVGHSVGEVVSAYVAGVYTLEEAVRISFHRSRLQQTMAGRGAMLAVGLAEAEAEKWLAGHPGVSVAAVNSFSAVTLSGDASELKQIAAQLDAREVFNKFLRVEVAYHSPQMDALREELLSCLSELAPKPAALPLYSTAHGGVIAADEWGAEYWWRNVRQPVHFAAAVEKLFAAGYSDFLEIGPHPVLANSLKECAAHLERKAVCFPSLRRGEPERPRLLLTLGELYCAGHDPDWTAVAPPSGRFLPAPQYPWQREVHWQESERSKMERFGLPGPVYLNRTVPGPAACWEVEINRNYFPFLEDHGVQDQVVFAGMGFIDAALALNRKIHEKDAVVLENVSFERVLIVEPAKLQYLMTEYDAEGGRFQIHSRVEGEEGGPMRHCRGRMIPQSEPWSERLDLDGLRARCSREVPVEGFYEDLARRGLHYGPAFRPTREIFVGENSYFLKMDAGPVAEDGQHPLHPVIFDAAIQPILYRSGREGLFVPFSVEQFAYFSRPSSPELYVYGELTSHSDTRLVAHVWVMDGEGNVHASARHMSLQVIDVKAGAAEETPFYQLEWRPAVLEPAGVLDSSSVRILADPEDSDIALAERLAALLPGAVLRISRVEDGFAGAGAGDLPAGGGTRNRLVVLWGTKDSGRNDAALALNEKLCGLLQEAARRCPAGVDVTLVTRGAKVVAEGDTAENWPASSLGAAGLVAVNEYEGFTCRSLDLAPGGDGDEATRVLAEIAAGSRGDIAFRGGLRFESVLGVSREDAAALPVERQSVATPVELVLPAKGRADALRFEPLDRVEPGAGEVEIRIHQSALNYKDLLKVDGRIHPGAYEDTFNGSDFGMECAGVVVRSGPGGRFQPGDRVVAILRRGFRTYATIPENFAISLPGGLGMEAAAIPVVYLAAYYGLARIARLQAGERVLIHHATGGLGLAAIEIARWIGAEIFATAGSDEKQEHLRRLGIRQVFSSRTLDFGQQIRAATENEGIDVVIGAQTGQAMHVSLSLLRTGGRYVEIGKKDIAEDNGLPLRPFNRNVIFASVDMDRLAKERPEMTRELLKTIFDHFARGDFQPGPVRVFPAAQVREAFEEMARSRHIGKLAVDFSQGEVDVVAEPRAEQVIRRDGCYIITGGTSGFGAATARWLASRGAGRIVLASRSGDRAPGVADAVRLLETLGAEVEVCAVDVADPAQVRSLVERCRSGSFVLRGVIHGAMVLDDAMMRDLTAARFRKVFLPKVAGALNFADALAEVSGLEFLVFYSSISALIGNRGQTGYVAANAALDGFARHLRARGMPAISINWGALAESGVVARDANLGLVLSSAGITGLRNRQALEALEKILRMARPQIGVFLVDWNQWHASHPHLEGDPRFRGLRDGAGGAGADAASALRHTLGEASREQRLRALEEHLQEVLAGTLKMARETVPLNRKLNEMGVDSLLVLELSLGIKERIGVAFSAMEFLKGPSVRQLAEIAEGRIWKN